ALVGGDHMNLLVLAADIGQQESPDPVSLVLLEQSRGPSGPARRWTADVDVPPRPADLVEHLFGLGGRGRRGPVQSMHRALPQSPVHYVNSALAGPRAQRQTTHTPHDIDHRGAQAP